MYKLLIDVCYTPLFYKHIQPWTFVVYFQSTFSNSDHN